MQARALLRQVGQPNNYTLTKHMAECLLADAHAAGRMRVAVVRPSVIGCIACAPLPGYFGNAAGVPSATLAYASGVPCLQLPCMLMPFLHPVHALTDKPMKGHSISWTSSSAFSTIGQFDGLTVLAWGLGHNSQWKHHAD